MYIYQKIVAILFAFWAGLVSAISFLEAWIKFRADGVTREIGLSIGKLVFTALNRIEIVLAITIWILLLRQKKFKVFALSISNLLFLTVSLILALQTLWLLPQLISRAEIIIHGLEPSGSSVHIWFILLEATKLVLLIVLSFKALVKK